MLSVSAYTKEAYCEALLALSERKELAKITVSDVVRECGTSRQTFYNHFKDINNLISYLPISVMSHYQGNALSRESVELAYGYALDHRAFFRQLPALTGQNNFRETFIGWARRTYYEGFLDESMSMHEYTLRSLAIDLYVAGVVNQFLEWCAADFSWPLKAMVEVQYAAAPDFIKTAE